MPAAKPNLFAWEVSRGTFHFVFDSVTRFRLPEAKSQSEIGHHNPGGRMGDFALRRVRRLNSRELDDDGDTRMIVVDLAFEDVTVRDLSICRRPHGGMVTKGGSVLLVPALARQVVETLTSRRRRTSLLAT